MKAAVGACLLGATAIAVASDQLVKIGHIPVSDGVVTVYSSEAGCLTMEGARRAAKHPAPDVGSPYVMGCWKPLDGTRLVVQFDDGTRIVLDRRQLIPTGREPHKFNL